MGSYRIKLVDSYSIGNEISAESLVNDYVRDEERYLEHI